MGNKGSGAKWIKRIYAVSWFFFISCHLVFSQSPIPDGARLVKIAGGFKFAEAPLWLKNGTLLFIDVPGNTIYKWEPGTGVSVFLRLSGHTYRRPTSSNGMPMVAQREMAITGIASDKKIEVPPNRYHGQKLNNPDHMVTARDGSIYFTEPSLDAGSNHKTRPVNGVYRLTADGKVHTLVSNLRKPSGLAFSPDEKFLYVNDLRTNNVWVYSVKSNGSLYDGRIFTKLRDPEAKFGSADGLRVDSKGNVFTTGPGGIWIFSSEGRLLDRVVIPEYASNLAWGGKDFKTLFITATHDIYSIPVKFSGNR